MNSPIPKHEYPLTVLMSEGRVKCRMLAMEKRPNGKVVCRRPDPFAGGEIEFTVQANDIIELAPPKKTSTRAEEAWAAIFQGFQYGEDETANAKAWFMHGFEAGQS